MFDSFATLNLSIRNITTMVIIAGQGWSLQRSQLTCFYHHHHFYHHYDKLIILMIMIMIMMIISGRGWSLQRSQLPRSFARAL